MTIKGDKLKKRTPENTSSKFYAKIRKIFEICKFRGMKKYEKYIKVVNLLAYIRKK